MVNKVISKSRDLVPHSQCADAVSWSSGSIPCVRNERERATERSFLVSKLPFAINRIPRDSLLLSKVLI